jgi:hypothetical protein
MTLRNGATRSFSSSLSCQSGGVHAVDGGVYDAGRDEIERKQYNAITGRRTADERAGHVVEGNCWSATRCMRSQTTRADRLDLIVVGLSIWKVGRTLVARRHLGR